MTVNIDFALLTFERLCFIFKFSNSIIFIEIVNGYKGDTVKMDNFGKLNLTLNESQFELQVTFDDIMTSEIVFFDASFEKDCIQFCKERNITFIPSLEFFDRCYELTDDDKFQEEKIEESQKVNIGENVFDKSVFEKFEKHHVLFVYRDDELEGVVHFCDYNRSPIFIYIYSLLLKFEKELRTLFTYYGMSNKDMIEFFRRQNTKYYREQFEKSLIPKNEIIMKELEPFQMFNLSDLIGLANSNDVIQISKSVIDIRNIIMHAKNPVKHRNYENDGLIYNYESFKGFFECVKLLQLEFRKVINKINYIRV